MTQPAKRFVSLGEIIPFVFAVFDLLAGRNETAQWSPVVALGRPKSRPRKPAWACPRGASASILRDTCCAGSSPIGPRQVAPYRCVGVGQCSRSSPNRSLSTGRTATCRSAPRTVPHQLPVLRRAAIEPGRRSVSINTSRGRKDPKRRPNPLRPPGSASRSSLASARCCWRRGSADTADRRRRCR